jgi:mRNA interferase MazF
MGLRRGEVYWVDFEPAVGGEIKKTRPAVVVSNDAANRMLNRVLVVPPNSQTRRLYPGETLVQVRGQSSKAMADQLTVASKLRFRAFVNRITDDELKSIELSILLQLGIGSRGVRP